MYQQQQQSYEVKLYCQLSNSIISEWVVRVGVRDLNSKIIDISQLSDTGIRLLDIGHFNVNLCNCKPLSVIFMICLVVSD